MGQEKVGWKCEDDQRTVARPRYSLSYSPAEAGDRATALEQMASSREAPGMKTSEGGQAGNNSKAAAPLAEPITECQFGCLQLAQHRIGQTEVAVEANLTCGATVG
jgi:hypothetical protein